MSWSISLDMIAKGKLTRSSKLIFQGQINSLIKINIINIYTQEQDYVEEWTILIKENSHTSLLKTENCHTWLKKWSFACNWWSFREHVQSEYLNLPKNKKNVLVVGSSPIRNRTAVNVLKYGKTVNNWHLSYCYIYNEIRFYNRYSNNNISSFVNMYKRFRL